MLSEAERRQAVVGWNQTERDYQPETSLHEVFESRCGGPAGAVAVVAEAEQLSYGELNRRANQLAHYLAERGVGPETLVGICMERWWRWWWGCWGC